MTRCRLSAALVVLVLLVSGAALAQTPTPAEIRVKADAGDANAQGLLGFYYSTGQGVPQDFVEAHKWHNLAASRASVENRKRFAERRDAVAAVMTPQQIADAQQLAREWQAAFDAR